ncbi:hypothetical protein C8J57DRAFT_1528559 [Mycena rebaudengoi]|nr:hypothetical protein C8J57DRAFT_1251088 [Mycena rebaudengoi]KAJ7238618.1 hypothetical protein C8J57DRAFT_1528559 [Mycena rebaudengoi]
MQLSSFALYAILATTALAAPAPSFVTRASCDILSCIKDIGPVVGACATAIAAEAANVVADVSCLGAAGKVIAQFPGSCDACLDEIDIGGVIDDVGDAFSDAVDAIGDGLEAVGDVISDGVDAVGDGLEAVGEGIADVFDDIF